MKHSVLPGCQAGLRSVPRRLSKESCTLQIKECIQKKLTLQISNLMTRCSVLQTFSIASEPAGSLEITDKTKNQKKNGESLVTGSATSRNNKSVILRIFVDQQLSELNICQSTIIHIK